MNKKKGMKLDVQSLCNEMISALVTGGAQGGLIVGIVWLALKFLPRTNAATRHGVWFVTLSVTALLPAVLFIAPFLENIPVKAAPTPQLEHVSSPMETEGLAPVSFEFEIDEGTAPETSA